MEEGVYLSWGILYNRILLKRTLDLKFREVIKIFFVLYIVFIFYTIDP